MTASIPQETIDRIKREVRLADLSRLPADPDIPDPHTLVWTFTPTAWNAFTNGATTLEIAVKNTLRAEGWGNTPAQPIPTWARFFALAPSTGRFLRWVDCFVHILFAQLLLSLASSI